jgi:hypothetical protein
MIAFLVSTQSLTEMSTRNLPGGKGRMAYKDDTLRCPLWAYYLQNVEASKDPRNKGHIVQKNTNN